MKISLILALLTGVVFFGFYIYSELQMNRVITDAVDDLEQPYYKGLASTCFKRSRAEYKCCISSVYAMSMESAHAISRESECRTKIDRLRCHGSFTWCAAE